MPIRIELPSGSSVVLDQGSVTLGTAPDCDVVLPNQEGLHPRHASIRRIANRWMIEAQGDWCLQVGDGVAGRKCWLESGNLVRLNEGGYQMSFHVNETSEDSVAPESTDRCVLSATKSAPSAHQVERSEITGMDTKAATFQAALQTFVKTGRKHVLRPIPVLTCIAVIVIMSLLALIPAGPESHDAQYVAAVSQNGKWGFVNESGKLVLSPQYDDIEGDLFGPQVDEGFHQGLVGVKQGDKWHFIDIRGTSCFGLYFDEVTGFAEGTACVRQGESWHCLSRSGTLSPPIKGLDRRHELWPFSDGMAVVRQKGIASSHGSTYGAIDHSGTLVIKPQFRLMSNFSDGRSVVLLPEVGDADWAVIDKAGRCVVPPRKEQLGWLGVGPFCGFSEGLVFYIDYASQTGGFLDIKGQPVIPAEKLSADRLQEHGPPIFREGLAPVATGYDIRLLGQPDFAIPAGPPKIGYIDRSGKYVIKPRFASARPFSEGLACVQPEQDGKWGYIDKTGQLVIGAEFDSAQPFKCGHAIVAKGMKSYCINKTGQVVFESRFDSLKAFCPVLEIASLEERESMSPPQVVASECEKEGQDSQGAVASSGDPDSVERDERANANVVPEKPTAVATGNGVVVVEGGLPSDSVPLRDVLEDLSPDQAAAVIPNCHDIMASGKVDRYRVRSSSLPALRDAATEYERQQYAPNKE